jgi:hypothetical protein
MCIRVCCSKPRILEWLMSDIVYHHCCVMVLTVSTTRTVAEGGRMGNVVSSYSEGCGFEARHGLP